MAEIWKYYLRLGPIRIPLGSRISHLDEIEKLETRTKISKCPKMGHTRGRCGKKRRIKNMEEMTKVVIREKG